jgi:hypothetical protein
MLGHASEIEKGMLFASDWNGPWYRANKVKKGKALTIVIVDGGQRVSFCNNTAVRFVKPGVDPQPGGLRGDYEHPVPRRKEV